MLKNKEKPLISAGIGLVSGVLNGMLGAGGGIIITYYLYYLLERTDKHQNDVFANALLTMLPMSVISAFIYFWKGHITLEKEMSVFFLPAIAGGVIGALLLKKINFKILKLVFVGIVIYSGISMLLG